VELCKEGWEEGRMRVSGVELEVGKQKKRGREGK